MNRDDGHIPAEIVALQRRADQLTATKADADVLLASLAGEAEAARRLPDLPLALRLDRRVHLLRQRRARTLQEINTLLEIIAARRARYGLAGPATAVERPPEPPGGLPA